MVFAIWAQKRISRTISHFQLGNIGPHNIMWSSILSIKPHHEVQDEVITICIYFYILLYMLYMDKYIDKYTHTNI